MVIHMGEGKEENSSSISDLKAKLKEEFKKKLKEELKKELLEEIYQELKAEEMEKTVGKTEQISHKKSVQLAMEKSPEKVKEAPKKAKPSVEITIKAVLKISSHALKYANENIPREDWVEVIGLLAGKVNKDESFLSIEDAYPMGHGNAIYAEIKDYRNYIRAYRDLRDQGYFIVGWYHSHPSYGLFMSEEDIGTQARYQKLWKKATALVVDPYMIDGTQTGFQIFRANLKKSTWYTIPYSIKGALTAKELPELLNFIKPIVDGKSLYLEYDES
jgi:proteasome lid subunit RPN8/RPN11